MFERSGTQAIVKLAQHLIGTEFSYLTFPSSDSFKCFFACPRLPEVCIHNLS